MAADFHESWMKIADVLNDTLGPMIEKVRARAASAPDGAKVSPELLQEVNAALTDAMAPLLWQVCILAALTMRKDKFLEIVETLYDQAELAVTTDRPIVEIFRLVTPQGQA